MEKIKRDKNRVDIRKLNPDEISGDDVTGGYIIKVDKEGWKPGIDSEYPPFPVQHKPSGISFIILMLMILLEEQVSYLSNFIGTFEYVMNGNNYADNISGYPKYLDVESFADYFILNELSKNVDGYRLSAYMYKDKDSNGGKLTAGPVWDHNFSFGNIGYYNGQYYIDENIESLLSLTVQDDNQTYGFNLGQNIPNPVSSVTTIPYELPGQSYKETVASKIKVLS